MLTRILLLVTVLSLTNMSRAQETAFQSWQKVATQKAGILNVYYFDNYPFAYTDPNGKVMGIEIDIVTEFQKWLKKYKGVQVQLKHQKYDSFDQFYSAIKDGGNGKMGLGSVTINKDRERWAQFSQPYLKNIAVLVSALDVNTLTSLKEFDKVFKDRVALVVKGSSHEKELLSIKERFYPTMKVSYVATPKEMLLKMKEDDQYFGYVDIITYMAFTMEQGGILRVHRNADISGEHFGFAFPPNSDWNVIFNEFMVGGFGFTSTAEYHAILDKYLELNVIQEVQMH